MRVTVLGVVLALAVLPALGQTQGNPEEPLPVAVNHTHPMIFHGVRPDGTVESSNWSGYAVTGSSFTVAKGSWIVPSVNCNQTPNSYSAFWVGIDGYSSSSVEQTGTISQCSGTSAEYYAWYEFYPNPSYEITSVPVSPGNKISASVTYNGSSEFTTTIVNETTGKSYSKTARVRGAARSSAEWIAEAPCCTSSGGILPLSDFGTAYFGKDYTSVSSTNYATDSSTSGPISSFGSNVQEIIMTGNSGDDKAVPSPLTSDGTSFDVVWEHEN
jgi:Peptidase A4 family